MSTGSNTTGSERTQSECSDSDETAPLVFPVGHYMGPFHPSQGAPAKHHIVRVGWDTPKLPDQAHFDVWALAHGLPSRTRTVRWTRQAIIETAAEIDLPGTADILDSLAARGLIVEVTPGSDQAREFAVQYRLRSLLIGLGNTPDDPVLDGIGLGGIPPLVKVRPRVFEIWQWAHLWPSVWAACEGLAWVAGQAGGARPEDAEPEALLDFMLEAFRTLISHNAVYLDVATTSRDVRPSAE
ncbi:MAG: hypothetical protein H0U22_07045 [Geodermatophilaceae bacterium]|nr:hypothetical protein [Geodermatophilaceae bacterium]